MSTNSLARRLALFLALVAGNLSDPIPSAAGDAAALVQGSRPSYSGQTDRHALAAPPRAGPVPLCAGLFQDIVGNRTRIIQASFVCIVIGIFILWKK